MTAREFYLDYAGPLGPNNTPIRAHQVFDFADAYAESLIQELGWLRSNFCDTHRQIAQMSSGPCGLCEARREKVLRVGDTCAAVCIAWNDCRHPDEVHSCTLPEHHKGEHVFKCPTR